MEIRKDQDTNNAPIIAKAVANHQIRLLRLPKLKTLPVVRRRGRT